MYSKDRTARTGRPGQDDGDRSAGTGLPAQDYSGKIASQKRKDGKLEQESQNGTANVAD